MHQMGIENQRKKKLMKAAIDIHEKKAWLFQSLNLCKLYL